MHNSMNTLLFSIALANITSSPIVATTAQKTPEPLIMTVIATAYTPREEETDSTPWITASGTTVREGIIAANFLPFGTKVKIGNKIYTVEDRMNRRFTKTIPERIDLAFLSLEKARKFGKKKMEIEVLNEEMLTHNIRISTTHFENEES